MNLAMQATAGTHVSGRWVLLLLFFSIVVLAENTARLDILPADGDDLTDEIYNNATGWRTPTVSENEWRREARQQPTSRIQFGYDSAYEEMRARDNNYSLDTGLGGIDHPQNTQLRISF